MPNWCSTCYKIVGKKEEVQSIYDVLTTLNNQPQKRVDNGFGRLWLGCIIDFLGGDWNKMCCRGEVTSFGMSNQVLTIFQETAWSEQSDFRHFLETKYPHIKVFYIAEECGCDVYVTNDHTGHYFPDKYLLDKYDEPEYFTNLQQAIRRVREITGKRNINTEEDMFDALNHYMEAHENEDIFYSLHKFEVVDD